MAFSSGLRAVSSGLTRRDLLKVSAVAGGGVLLQVTLPMAAASTPDDVLVGSKELNVYVRIDRDGQITIYSSIPEMGQGIRTTLPMIIAEEMGARWEDVRVLDAPLDEDRFGLQIAGGSNSVPRNIGTMRRMGASAREMLIGAAALMMEVERKDLDARDSEVVHTSGERRSFGQLASLAAEQPVPDPDTLTYRDPSEYRIIGTSVSGVDNFVIATGLSEFGIDVDVPGMKYATYVRCPRIGGAAVRFNESEIKALPGVTDAFILAPNEAAGKSEVWFLDGVSALRGGVAIVGDDTWSVFDARGRLEVEWDESLASTDDWSAMVAWAERTAREGGGEVIADHDGVDAAFADETNRTCRGLLPVSVRGPCVHGADELHRRLPQGRQWRAGHPRGLARHPVAPGSAPDRGQPLRHEARTRAGAHAAHGRWLRTTGSPRLRDGSHGHLAPSGRSGEAEPGRGRTTFTTTTSAPVDSST